MAFFPFSLSARIFICCSLSSPLTYNTFSFLSSMASCSMRVDLPIPGSPPTKTRLPGTIPPPRVRFNSRSPVAILWISPAAISSSARGKLPFLSGFSSFHTSLSSGRSITSSVKVFHSAQLGHLPCHFGDSNPQFLQKNAVFAFAAMYLPHQILRRIFAAN